LKIQGLDKFLEEMKKAASGGLKKEFALWLEGIGMEFLDLIQGEIIRTETVDTRRLLNSFNRGNSENIWTITKDGLSLEVGTNLSYASFVNDGHFTIDPKKNLDRRWVPGRWKVNRFEYDPDEKESGMLLKFTWVEGTHYWDNALAIFEKMFEKSLERRLQEWLDTTFK
jgi:hypothetical protein